MKIDSTLTKGAVKAVTYNQTTMVVFIVCISLVVLVSLLLFIKLKYSKNTTEVENNANITNELVREFEAIKSTVNNIQREYTTNFERVDRCTDRLSIELKAVEKQINKALGILYYIEKVIDTRE